MTLRPEIAKALGVFKQRLESIYGDRLAETILFGSVARGQDTPESDADVLVVLSGPVDHFAERQRLAGVVVNGMAHHGIFITPVVMSEEHFRHGDWPLLTNVREEGIAL